MEENKELKEIIELKNKDIRELEKSNKVKKETVVKLNTELKDVKLKFSKEKEKEKKEHKTEVKHLRKELGEENKVSIKLREKLDDLEHENSKLKENIGIKDDLIGKAMEEKVSLEEKVESLLNLLYGCNKCGLLECECSEDCGSDLLPQSETPYEPSPPSAAEAPAAQQLPQPSSGSSPWTPPPTPPCDSCGGINFGPCPSSICFNCIEPLQNKPETDTSSPSRTPPGTPPLLRNSVQEETGRDMIWIKAYNEE